MELSTRELAGRALTLLASRLAPILDVRLAHVLNGLAWTELLSELDRLKGKVPGHYSRDDPHTQLRLLTERLGQLGYPLDDRKRTVSTLGSELRIVRNHVAHPEDEMDLLDAWRAADFVVRLLDHFGDAEGVSAATELRDNIPRLGEAPSAISVDVDPVVQEADAAEEAKAYAPPADEEVLENPDGDRAGVLGRHRAGFEPWPMALLGDVSVLDNLKVRKHSQSVRAAIQEIVEFEGPVLKDRVTVLVCNAFGLTRVEKKRKNAVLRQVENIAVQPDNRGFLWPESIDRGTWAEFRPHSGGKPRPFAEIPVEELANAARFLRSRYPGLERVELEYKVLATFGFRNRTGNVRTRLADAWKLMDSRG